MPDIEYDDADVIDEQEYLLDQARRQREMQLLYQAVLARSREHDELQAVFSQWMKYDDENRKLRTQSENWTGVPRSWNRLP